MTDNSIALREMSDNLMDEALPLLHEFMATLSAERAYLIEKNKVLCRKIADTERQIRELTSKSSAEIRSATSDHPARTIVLRTAP